MPTTAQRYGRVFTQCPLPPPPRPKSEIPNPKSENGGRSALFSDLGFRASDLNSCPPGCPSLLGCLCAGRVPSRTPARPRAGGLAWRGERNRAGRADKGKLVALDGKPGELTERSVKWESAPQERRCRRFAVAFGGGLKSLTASSRPSRRKKRDQRFPWRRRLIAENDALRLAWPPCASTSEKFSTLLSEAR